MRSAPPPARAGCDEREVFIVEQRLSLGCVRRRQREPRPVRLAQADRPAHSVGQARRRRRASARSGTRASLDAGQRDADHAAARSIARRSRRAWFAALADAGVDDRRHAARTRQRCRRGSPRGSPATSSASRADTLAFLAERCEGNLLAARQEIDKLGAAAAGRASSRTMTSSARSPTSRASTSRNCPKRGSSGDAARRCASSTRCAAKASRSRLRSGSSARTCTRLPASATRWRPASRCRPQCAARASGASARVRSSARPGASPPAQIERLLHALAALDALAKGIGQRDPWDVLVSLALDLCARPVPIDVVDSTS